MRTSPDGSRQLPRPARFAIDFAVTSSRDLLRRILKEHAPDDARRQLAERVLEYLEAS